MGAGAGGVVGELASVYCCGCAGDEVVVLAIRGLGGYTKTLQAVTARENLKLSHQSSGNSQVTEGARTENLRTSTMKLRLDGPHGLGETQWGLHTVTVLVAGGIGITPGMSIALHIVKTAKKSLEAGVTVAEARAQWHVHLLWIIKDVVHAEWFENELNELTAAADDPSIPITFDIKIHVTANSRDAAMQQQQPEAAETYDLTNRLSHRGSGIISQGRPNLTQYFNEVRNTHPGQDAAVNACGPRSMIREVRRAAAKASRDGSVFSVEEEVFEL